ncbi:MAG: phosphopyruvate hydratase, partial [Deltaproteobacteria bacterium]|nr:phosphopyruvate hydratase [Deltaproteobacteria bacterium]
MNTFAITDINAREIIDNRGMPTVRVTVFVGSGVWGRADVPCGSSTGSYEAADIRDGGSRYRGKGVRKAIRNIHEIICPRLHGMNAAHQQQIDAVMIELDGTDNKSKLGGNAILGISLAVSRAAAAASGASLYKHLNTNASVLPVPQACLINGGLHAGNDLDIQEFCIMPTGASTFSESVQILSETFMNLKEILIQKLGKSATNSSEDGGFAPPISSTRQAMDYLHESVEHSGFSDKIVYGLDFAATEYYNKKAGTYLFEGSSVKRDEMIGFIMDLLDEYPTIVSIEDPLHENDFEGMGILTEALEDKIIIGDDMFATN